jgi:hypothetical protein
MSSAQTLSILFIPAYCTHWVTHVCQPALRLASLGVLTEVLELLPSCFLARVLYLIFSIPSGSFFFKKFKNTLVNCICMCKHQIMTSTLDQFRFNFRSSFFQTINCIHTVVAGLVFANQKKYRHL